MQNESFVRGFDFYRPWAAAITAAHVRAELATITRSSFTVDFCDFAIAIPRG
jgi:hypothetical protein